MELTAGQVIRCCLTMVLVLAACGCNTGPDDDDPFVPTLSASISGAVSDEFVATKRPPTEGGTESANVFGQVAGGTPGMVTVVGGRTVNGILAILSITIMNVRATGVTQNYGVHYRHGSPDQSFTLDATVLVTRLTQTRLTGEFTAIGIGSPDSAGATVDTIYLGDGHFDVPLTSRVPEPVP